MVTKTDLAPAEPLRAAYAPLGVEIVNTTRDQRRPTQLRHRLADHVTVLIGQSGVGKSTLVNQFVPDAHRDTGSVNEVTGPGPAHLDLGCRSATA